MYHTREYTTLVGDDGSVVKILPNKPFKALKGNYRVTSNARILNEDGSFYRQLKPGEQITGVGEMPKRTRKKKAKVEDDV